MEHSEVIRKLHSAYCRLLRNDFALLELNANERSITHKLAEYLQSEFQEWHVDCEYNRDGDIPKQLSVQNISTNDTDARTVFPDIVIHHRNTKNNLVVIEAKKSSTAHGSADEEKLKAYIAEHRYQFAFAVIFPIESRISQANPSTDITEVTA
ncbi:MAG: BsuBI/PstI family type II restriction endonuclease [Actinomycetota bacterium]|nr:BsuBI/PstI family type II restriction endonuclease [Actinomycetota bacterium]